MGKMVLIAPNDSPRERRELDWLVGFILICVNNTSDIYVHSLAFLLCNLWSRKWSFTGFVFCRLEVQFVISHECFEKSMDASSSELSFLDVAVVMFFLLSFLFSFPSLSRKLR